MTRAVAVSVAAFVFALVAGINAESDIGGNAGFRSISCDKPEAGSCEYCTDGDCTTYSGDEAESKCGCKCRADCKAVSEDPAQTPQKDCPSASDCADPSTCEKDCPTGFDGFDCTFEVSSCKSDIASCKSDAAFCKSDNALSKSDALIACTDQCPPDGAAPAAGPAPAPSPGDANATSDTTESDSLDSTEDSPIAPDSDSGTTSGSDSTTMMSSCKTPNMDANIAFVGDCSVVGDTCSSPLAVNTWCCCSLDGAITINNVNTGFQSFGADP